MRRAIHSTGSSTAPYRISVCASSRQNSRVSLRDHGEATTSQRPDGCCTVITSASRRCGATPSRAIMRRSIRVGRSAY